MLKAAATLTTQIYEKAKQYEEEYNSVSWSFHLFKRVIFYSLFIKQLAKAAIDNRREAKANNQIFVTPEDKVVLLFVFEALSVFHLKLRKFFNFFASAKFTTVFS